MREQLTGRFSDLPSPSLRQRAAEVVAGLSGVLSPEERPAIVAGHYCVAPLLAELSNRGRAEAYTFAFGLQLLKQWEQRGVEPELVLWINDIGVAPDKRRELKATYHLPENYQRLASKEDVDTSRVRVFFESTMRNRASVLLRKLHKRSPQLFERVPSGAGDLVRCVDESDCQLLPQQGMTSYVVLGPHGERLVVKDGPNPKCNLILATFFQVLHQRLASALVVNVFNELYESRLELGEHVCKAVLGSEQRFVTLLCDGQDLELAPFSELEPPPRRVVAQEVLPITP